MTLCRCVIALSLGLLMSSGSVAAESEPAGTQAVTAVDPAQALRALKREHDALLAQQPALQEAADRAVTLADQNQQLEQQLQTVRGQVDGLREETARLRSDDRRRWFVTGAAVLAAGLVLGLIVPALRGRRRRGYGGFR